jgi:hypothetical protein
MEMHHYTLTAPSVTNAGEPSGYALKVRIRLQIADITGWTEQRCKGYWNGKAEAGTLFTVYLMDRLPETLQMIGRAAMPDQEAVQVTYHGTIELWEA